MIRALLLTACLIPTPLFAQNMAEKFPDPVSKTQLLIVRGNVSNANTESTVLFFDSMDACRSAARNIVQFLGTRNHAKFGCVSETGDVEEQ